MNFYTAPPGTTFKALIVNISPGRVTIRIDGGGNFTARTLVLPDARIGEESYFRVKSNDMKGLVQLEMLKGSLQERQENMVQEALQGANIYAGEENIKLGRVLVENNLTVDAENLRVLESLTNPSQHLSASLAKLHEAVARLAESEVQHALAEILGPPERMYLALENTRKPLGSYYEEVNETAERMLAQIKQADRALQNIQETLLGIRENLSMIKQMTQHVQYFQIPFVWQGEPKQGELFMYDKSNGVIALDTANLGRVEVQTNKEEKRLTLKFCGEKNDVLALIRAKSPRLTAALREKGFVIEGISYAEKNERTTVLSPSPAQPSEDNRRYSFDMRV